MVVALLSPALPSPPERALPNNLALASSLNNLCPPTRPPAPLNTTTNNLNCNVNQGQLLNIKPRLNIKKKLKTIIENFYWSRLNNIENFEWSRQKISNSFNGFDKQYCELLVASPGMIKPNKNPILCVVY